MPIAENRLERLQVLKLLQSVRSEDVEQIEKLVNNGIPNLINFSGILHLQLRIIIIFVSNFHLVLIDYHFYIAYIIIKIYTFLCILGREL